MGLSIIIPCLNDHAQINLTIKSIRETTKGNTIDVIVIDDCSEVPVQLTDKSVRLFRMEQRVGGGVARHIGALHSRHDHLLFVDSHMRFRPGWFDKAMDRIIGRDWVVHIAKCLGLSEDNMDLDKAAGAYHGAKMVYIGKDPNKPDKASVLEGVWSGPKEDDAEIECMMGACYFWPRRLFLDLGGKNLLRDWGGEEPFTSLKVWLTGGCVRLMADVEIGHMFRNNNGYDTPWVSIIYNKLMIAKVCMPPPAAHAIEMALRLQYEQCHIDAANKLIALDQRLIQTEQHRLKALQRLPFESLLARFGHEKFW